MIRLIEAMKWQIAFLAVVLAFATVTHAQDQNGARAIQQNSCPENLNRPCIGLVLGGGGARGSAHIGVLKVLEERRIPIDLIVGTSIGSFVGGLYASGKTSDEIKQLFQQADWNSGYQDSLSRSQIPNRRKRQLDSFPIHLDLGVSGGNIKFPKGFLQGQGMKNLIDSMLGRYAHFDTFNDLPIPFRAVAADIESGEEVVLEYGDLATALHISMSLPGVLRPIERDGRVLVDGGIVNNLPVSVAKSLGADIVIAVQIGTPALEKDDLLSGVVIYNQTASLLVRKNVIYQKSLLDDQDVYIQPDIEGVGLLSFDKALEAFAAGYEKAQDVFSENDNLQALANLPKVDKIIANAPLNDEASIDQIILSNSSRLSDSYILNRMDLQTGELITNEDLVIGTNRLYGQGTIARINTSFERYDDQNILDIDVEEKEWGPGYLDFKLTFEDDFDSFSRYQVGASHRLTNLSPYGAELYTTGEFGTEKNFSTELYWPIKNSGFFWDAQATYDRGVFEFKNSGVSFGSVVATQAKAIGGIGWNSTDRFDTLLGLIYEDGELELPGTLATSLMRKEIGFRREGLVFGLNIDSLDHSTFPRHGWKLGGRIIRSRDELLNIVEHSTQFDVEFNGVVSFGRNSFRNLVRLQSTITDEPTSLLGTFSLGGFLNLSGNVKNFLSGQHVRFFSIVYTYELAENDFGAIDLPLYLGVSAETGNAWSDRDDIDYGNMINSGSLFVGWDSPLGPAYLAYGRSETGEKSAYVFLGIAF